MNGWIDLINGFLFQTNAYQCSRTSYALLYCILASTLIISAGGVYMWRRMFVHRSPAGKTNINKLRIPMTHHQICSQRALTMHDQNRIISNQSVIAMGKLVWMVGICLLLLSVNAFAQTEDPLGDGVCKLVIILTGKWLFGFTILATVGAGAALLFGAEISDGIKKFATIITIVGMIVGMGSILSFAFQKFSSSPC